MDLPIARYPMEANGETIIYILYIGMYLVQEVVHTNGMHASWDVDHTF